MEVEEEPSVDHAAATSTVIAISTNTGTYSSWKRDQVLALISKVEECFEEFYDYSKKKIGVWNMIAKRMQEDGYDCTGLECDKKWRNLKSTYAKVLKRQLHGEMYSRFEYFDELHHILGQEIESLELNDQNQIDIQEDVSSPTHVEYQEISIDGDFLWSEEAVIRLLGLLRHHNAVLQYPNDSYHPGWQNVAQDMNEGGHAVNGEQCQRKWVSLLEGFRFHKAEAQATGSVPLWVFYTRVRDLCSLAKPRTTIRSASATSEKKRGRPRGRSRGRGGRFRASSRRTTVWADRMRRVVADVVRKRESEASIGQRLSELEERVEKCQYQREMFADTNTVLKQILKQLRKVNSVFDEGPRKVVQAGGPKSELQHGERIEHDDSNSGSNQGIIIVEAY